MEIYCPKCGAKIDISNTSDFCYCVCCGWGMNASFDVSTSGSGTWDLSDRRNIGFNFYYTACSSI